MGSGMVALFAVLLIVGAIQCFLVIKGERKMKKRFFAAVLALALVLGLAAPAGLVILAEATVSASDAQAYLDILNRTNPTDSFLIDFDGDGGDELLTVKSNQDSASFSIWTGSKALLTDQKMGDGIAPSCFVCTKGGKTYICNHDVPSPYMYHDYYTVENGQCVKEALLYENHEMEAYLGVEVEYVHRYTINGHEVDVTEYLNVRDAYQNQFSICPWENPRHGNVRPQLEEIVKAEALKNATPDEILASIAYIGNRNKCKMDAKMADAYADVIEKLSAQNLNVALADLADDGYPILIVASGYGWVESIWGYKNGETYNADITGIQNSGYGKIGNKGAICGVDWWISNQTDWIYTVSHGQIDFAYEVSFEEWDYQASFDVPADWKDKFYIKQGNTDITAQILQTIPSTISDVRGKFECALDHIGYTQGGNFCSENTAGDSYLEIDTTPASTAVSLLHAYAQAQKFPTYTYAQAESGDKYYSDVAAAVSGQGTIQAIYKLLEDAYYVLLENGGAYSGAVVRGQRENGKPVWKVTQTDAEPAAEDVLSQLVNRLATVANLNLDYSKLRGSPALDDLADYLREVLENIDGLAPNDPAKNDLASFVDSAVATLASGAVTGKDNRLTIGEKTVTDLAAQAKEAYDALNKVLRDSDVELNKTLAPVVRVLWSGIDEDKACQLTFDKDVSKALDGFGLQVLLGNSQTYVQISSDGLSDLIRALGGGLSVQLFQEEPGIYDIRFLDSDGEVVERLSSPVTIGLPASSVLTTIIATYAGGSDNWGGQYDAASDTISFETSFSGRYEVLENSVAIDDIDGLSEESQAAIAFTVSKGYFTVENGLFRPNDPLNRYEFTEALVGMFFALDRSLTTSFPDVPADSPYYPYVASAQARDIVKGMDDGTFSGETNITREQVFALAARTLMDQKGYTQPTDLDNYLGGYSDRDAISGWAEAQVALAVREGVAARSSALYPQADMTREQAAVVLYRLFQLLYEISPVALDVPEAAPEGTSTPIVAAVGAAVAVAALAGGGAVVLMRKKPKAASRAEEKK